MLAIILGILGSGGFGSLVGLVGGYFNRRLDLEGKKVDLEDHAAQRAHELLKMEADRKYMESEYAQKIQVASIEADAAVEVAGYGAMEKSYGFASTTPADGIVDKFSKSIRPLLTLLFLLFTVVIFSKIQALVDVLGPAMQTDKVVELYFMIIQWVIFQAGVSIGWWFAMRPGRQK